MRLPFFGYLSCIHFNFKMAAPRRRVGFGGMGDGMDERKAMEEEMSRFEQEILTGQDDDDDDQLRSYSPGPPLVPPGIPQALSVLGTPDPNLMNLRFPAPPPPLNAPPRPLTTSAQQTPRAPDPPGFPQQGLGVALVRLAGLAPPPPPGTLPPPASDPADPPGSFQRPLTTEGERLPSRGQMTSQPFPPAVQQVSVEAPPMAPRPAFVPHQVRARPPAAPMHHRPPANPMQHRAQAFLSSVPRPGRPDMDYPPRHPPPRGPPAGPMMRPRYPPMMPPRPPGGMRHSPVVIQAKPTTYSAKPVRFSAPATTRGEPAKEAPSDAKADKAANPQPGYNVQTPAYTQPAAFTLPAARSQPPGMYSSAAASAAALPAAADYSAMVQQQQQQQQLADSVPGTSNPEQKKKEKKKKFIRTAASTTWEDESLAEWDPNDFRIFCGDLGNEVTDDLLTKVFGRYPSFTKAKVVRDKRTSKTKGYGFVSFKDPNDFVQAMREWNGKYVGNRPIKLRKSSWKDRNMDMYKKKQKEKQRLGLR